MSRLTIATLSVLTLCLGALPARAQVQFEERDGLVIMEMESVPIPDGADWVEQNTLEGFTGEGYYRFTGNGICNGPANSPLRYTFRIHDPGVYELRLRGTRIYHCVEGTPEGADNHCQEGGGARRGCESFGEPEGTVCANANHCIRTDLSNDAFISIEDASGEHLRWVGQSNDEVTKLFGGGNNAWRWTGTRALDPGGAKRDAHWDLASGDYTLVVQGRSKDFRIDRMALFHTERQSISGAESLPETLAAPPMTPEDMGQTLQDMDSPSSDMDTSMPDSPDMAHSTMMDMNSPNMPSDMPGEGSPEMGESIDQGSMASGGTSSGEDEGCATSHPGAPVAPPLLLLGVLVGGIVRRRASGARRADISVRR